MSIDSDASDRSVVITTSDFDAVLFDMESIVTDAASLHQRACRQLFDDCLIRRAGSGSAFHEFTDDDYRSYVDGRAREDGVAAFLRSRGIDLREGSPEDLPGYRTRWALANQKNELFRALLAEQAPRVFASTIALTRHARDLGLRTAVVTASPTASALLSAAGVEALFDVCVDGTELRRLSLPGKPDPSTFLEAARQLGVHPARAVIVEDARSGLRAGREGGFGLVIGLDRAGNPQDLRAHGAHAVVEDLAAVSLDAGTTSESGHCELCDRASTMPRAWIFQACDRPSSGEGTREALCTLGNGYMATRGCAADARADRDHYPGTYAAGVFNRLVSHVDGHTREDEAIVNLPNWLPVSLRVQGGAWFAPSSRSVHDHWLLDLRLGVLEREVHLLDHRDRRTRLRERRLVSMADPHLAAQQVAIISDNWSSQLSVRVGIDTDVGNTNVAEYAALASRHLALLDTGHSGNTLWVLTRTTQSHVRIAQAMRTRVEGRPHPTMVSGRDGGRVTLEVELPLDPGDAAFVEKVVATTTSRDHAISEPSLAAREAVTSAPEFAQLLSAHKVAWHQLWRRFHLAIDGPESAQQALNLHLFHVLQTLSPHTADLDVGVPARGFHGEGYRGHYFWDELFIFGLLNTRFPQLTRELLLYRHRRLPKARELAQHAGHVGALFPWQSGSDGREETPQELLNLRSGRWMPDNSRRQYHVTLAIAYNVWQYWEVTRDLHFLVAYGADLLVEIARFWASLATHDPLQDRFHLRGVMGPDEFHDGYPGRPGEGIDNNAYTNIMVAWLMGRVVELLDIIGPSDRDELLKRLSVANSELSRWERMRRRLVVPHHDGMISQFSGYETLLELDWDRYRSRYTNIGRLDLILEAEGDTPNRYKLSKQADVLMLFYLFSADELRDILGRLGYHLEPETIPRTIEYYLHRTSHGSTLSRVVHSWVLARSDRARSWSLFNEALEADISDIQGGTTREGIHLGAMAGTVDIMQRCYTGLELRDDQIILNPLLPDDLHGLEFNMHYRNHSLHITIDHEHVHIASDPAPAPAIQIRLRDQVLTLNTGDQLNLLWHHPSTDPHGGPGEQPARPPSITARMS